MGFYGCAYVVEGEADAEGVTLTTTVFGPAGDLDRALFFWSEGARPPGLHSYANGSLHSSVPLWPIAGYPSTERRGAAPGESASLILIEENFRAQSSNEPVLFHFLLPRRFVPRRDLAPLITPSRPSVLLRDDRLSVTFVTTGEASVAFWAEAMSPGSDFASYDFNSLFDKPAVKSGKATIEINLGIVKFSFGTS